MFLIRAFSCCLDFVLARSSKMIETLRSSATFLLNLIIEIHCQIIKNSLIIYILCFLYVSS